jgi:hypothetical protein
MKSQQRGLSIISLLFVGGVLAFGGVIAAQVAPTAIEYLAIAKAAKKVAVSGGSIPEIRANFDKAQEIDSFKAVSGKDLDISKNGEKIVVSFAYTKEIHLGGPAYLLLKYASSSDK